MKQNQRNYHSYLLRLWRSSNEESAAWHIMLENPHTGERHGFTGFPNLTAFLSETIGQRPATAAADEEADVQS